MQLFLAASSCCALAALCTTLITASSLAQFELLGATLASLMVVGGAAYLYRWQCRQLNECEARLSAVGENSHDAIIGKTPDGIVTSWNHGAELMFGYGA